MVLILLVCSVFLKGFLKQICLNRTGDVRRTEKQSIDDITSLNVQSLNLRAIHQQDRAHRALYSDVLGVGYQWIISGDNVAHTSWESNISNELLDTQTLSQIWYGVECPH